MSGIDMGWTMADAYIALGCAVAFVLWWWVLELVVVQGKAEAWFARFDKHLARILAGRKGGW